MKRQKRTVASGHLGRTAWGALLEPRVGAPALQTLLPRGCTCSHRSPGNVTLMVTGLQGWAISTCRVAGPGHERLLLTGPEASTVCALLHSCRHPHSAALEQERRLRCNHPTRHNVHSTKAVFLQPARAGHVPHWRASPGQRLGQTSRRLYSRHLVYWRQIAAPSCPAGGGVIFSVTPFHTTWFQDDSW